MISDEELNAIVQPDKVQADDWDLLEALSTEIAQGAKDVNLKSDDDFVRAAKDVRTKLANHK